MKELILPPAIRSDASMRENARAAGARMVQTILVLGVIAAIGFVVQVMTYRLLVAGVLCVASAALAAALAHTAQSRRSLKQLRKLERDVQSFDGIAAYIPILRSRLDKRYSADLDRLLNIVDCLRVASQHSRDPSQVNTLVHSANTILSRIEYGVRDPELLRPLVAIGIFARSFRRTVDEPVSLEMSPGEAAAMV